MEWENVARQRLPALHQQQTGPSSNGLHPAAMEIKLWVTNAPATFPRVCLSTGHTMSHEPEHTERELVEQILDGDREAFLNFIDRYERLVKHVVFRMVDDERDREELCQDVFVRAYRYLDGFRFESKLSTWLARIARNTCLNHLEKKDHPLYADHAPAPDGESPDARAALNRIEDPDTDVSRAAVDREQQDVVRRGLDTLAEHYRTALTLYHLEGMSVSQISEIMENPEGTVKSHLYRGRKKLKDWLLEHYDQEELTI